MSILICFLFGIQGKKASRVLAMIFLFCFFDYFNFSTFEIVYLAGIKKHSISSGTLAGEVHWFSVFHLILWIVFQDLSCNVF